MSFKSKVAVCGFMFLAACGGHKPSADAKGPVELVDTDDSNVPVEPVAAVAEICSQVHYPIASTAGGELIEFLVGLNNAALLGRLTQTELVSVYRDCVVSRVGSR